MTFTFWGGNTVTVWNELITSFAAHVIGSIGYQHVYFKHIFVQVQHVDVCKLSTLLATNICKIKKKEFGAILG